MLAYPKIIRNQAWPVSSITTFQFDCIIHRKPNLRNLAKEKYGKLNQNNLNLCLFKSTLECILLDSFIAGRAEMIFVFDWLI